MDTLRNVKIPQTKPTDDAVNVSNIPATERNKKTSGTTTPKPPKGGSAESQFHRADDAELVQQLEDCKNSAAVYQNLTGRTDRALYEALARSYVWWRICTEGESRFPDYLANANINLRTGTREFSDLIRLTFSLSGDGKSKAEKRLETKAVNRHATAMAAIDRHFANETLNFGDESNIVVYIRNAGVEALIQQQFTHKRENRADDPDAKREAIQKNRLERMEAFFWGRDISTSFTALDLQRGEGGLVPLVGRVGQNSKIDVVGVVPCTEEVFENLLLNNYADLENVPDELNFFSEVLSLGEVIKEGMPSRYPVKEGADTSRKTTEMLRCQRLLLVQGSNAHAVVGLARAESSIVLHARPNFAIDWPVGWDVYMDTKYRRWFEKNVVPPSKRRDCACKIAASDDGKDSDVCIAVTSPDLSKPKSLYLRDYNRWAKGRSDQHGQLMVDVEQDIEWDFEATIDPAAFETINRTYLKPYGKLRKAKTRAATLSMQFANGTWTLKHHDAPDEEYAVRLSSEAKNPRWMTVIGLELAAVGQKIVDLKLTDTITIRGDYDGLLQFNVKTNAGTYAIHIPTVLEDGKTHSPKRLRKYPNGHGSKSPLIEADG